MTETCCMCGKESRILIRRHDGDDYCPECHDRYCEHLHQKTEKVAGGLETVSYCLDCGEFLG